MPMLADAHISSLGYLWSNSLFTVLFAYVVFFWLVLTLWTLKFGYLKSVRALSWFRCRLADYLDIGHLEKRFPESII